MIPIRDDAPREIVPVVTWLLIAANVVVFLYQLTLATGVQQMAFMNVFGAVPAHIGAALAGAEPPVAGLLPMLTSMFLHGGWMHLIGNMLVLKTFGDNIEDDLGHGLFILFYLVCGVIATAAHFLSDPTSPIPVVGASGAIAGVMGAYLIRFPKARVTLLVPIVVIWTTFRLPAYVVLTGWFALQVLNQTGGPVAGGVAWWAHIGGFCAGVALILTRRRRRSWEFAHGWRANR